MPTTGSIYIHVPFCQNKCPYCHFYSIYPKEGYLDRFTKALIVEWKQKQFSKKIVSIYFGGGTPSLLGPKRIEKILDCISKDALLEDPEITLETNPSCKEDYKDFVIAGINRISIGTQTFSDNLLKILGRKHSVRDNVDCVEKVFKGGVENISIDLMYDIPTQKQEDITICESFIKNLPVSHVSLYNLTFEENTPFFTRKEEFFPLLPSDKESLGLLEDIVGILENLSFTRYEISAFAKKGKMSRHNLGYWTGREFVGIGPSAFSFVNGIRVQNTPNFLTYEKKVLSGIDPKDFVDDISLRERKKELLAIGLRVLSGVDIEEFEKKHGRIEEETKKEIEALIKEGMLEKKEKLCLTKKGVLFYDLVAQRII